ncbi:hypothetical protein VOLCADRAFT_121709 [Volvox carteri f. nagariensis]|uniref:Uncharacterized protein n=1 Tax=Volvox carteri f. nagariensis TaxID=3068 RepID=D8UI93_VOLCA|nr:uncharacterized protein VOLCADRAFT_121709 [Volvox carteri f. nagariensis]EFJ40524.1 hypothetical protein VOLCADRAFT_121709 [Volvox carteri f. nagariensis]|eukprot:XP_002958374.1 hypothetical protein VOLCADRAFT_121709 [Volvox carteri f. nagariensis]
MLPYSSAGAYGGSPYGRRKGLLGTQNSVTGILALVAIAALGFSIFTHFRASSAHSQKAALKTEVDSLRSELRSIQSQFSSRNAELEQLQHTYGHNQRRITELTNQLQRKEADLVSKEQALQQQAKEREIIDQHRSGREVELTKMVEDLRAELLRSDGVIEALDTKMAKMEATHVTREKDWHGLANKWIKYEQDLHEQYKKCTEEVSKLRNLTMALTITFLLRAFSSIGHRPFLAGLIFLPRSRAHLSLVYSSSSLSSSSSSLSPLVAKNDTAPLPEAEPTLRPETDFGQIHADIPVHKPHHFDPLQPPAPVPSPAPVLSNTADLPLPETKIRDSIVQMTAGKVGLEAGQQAPAGSGGDGSLQAPEPAQVHHHDIYHQDFHHEEDLGHTHNYDHYHGHYDSYDPMDEWWLHDAHGDWNADDHSHGQAQGDDVGYRDQDHHNYHNSHDQQHQQHHHQQYDQHNHHQHPPMPDAGGGDVHHYHHPQPPPMQGMDQHYAQHAQHAPSHGQQPDPQQQQQQQYHHPQPPQQQQYHHQQPPQQQQYHHQQPPQQQQYQQQQPPQQHHYEHQQPPQQQYQQQQPPQQQQYHHQQPPQQHHYEHQQPQQQHYQQQQPPQQQQYHHQQPPQQHHYEHQQQHGDAHQHHHQQNHEHPRGDLAYKMGW